MTPNFLFSFGWFNLASLSSEKKKGVVRKCGLLEEKWLKYLNMKKIIMGVEIEPNYINK